MRNSFSLVALVLCIGFASMAIADGAGGGGKGDPTIPVLPIFESGGNVSFDSGSGWWNMAQYDAGAQIYIGASSTARVIRTSSSIYVDKYNPANIRFDATMNMIDGKIPTGNLDYYQNSSSGESNSSMRVFDFLDHVWVGEDESGNSIFLDEWRTNLNLNLNVPANIKSVNGNTGRWTESWGDENGEVYFSRSGDQISFNGYGTPIGADPIEMGRSLVESGMASYSSVPEPASLTILVLSGLGLLARRRK